MKQLFALMFILSFTNPITSQENKFYNSQIIDSILIDTIVDDWWYKEKIISLVDTMHFDKGDSNKMFPFSTYTRVESYDINEEYFKTENIKYYEKVFIKGEINSKLIEDSGITLNDIQIIKLLDFINNPLNFNWSDCGTPLTSKLIVFYNKSEIKSIIQISCYSQQIICYPYNVRSKLGGINPKKSVNFQSLLNEF